MRLTGFRGIGLIVATWTLAQPADVVAQIAPAPAPVPSQGQAMPPAAMMANPYLNPYMNPYLNPGATQQPMNANNALLYLYAANSAKGGIGSGRLSNPPRAAASRSRAAEMPDSVSRPGGGAARFFNPGPVNANGAGRYYNRPNRYFNNNGR